MLHNYCIRRFVKNRKKIDETNIDKLCNAKKHLQDAMALADRPETTLLLGDYRS